MHVNGVLCREPERTAGTVQPLFSGYRSHETVQPQRSSIVEQQSFSALSRNEPYEIRG